MSALDDVVDEESLPDDVLVFESLADFAESDFDFFGSDFRESELFESSLELLSEVDFASEEPESELDDDFSAAGTAAAARPGAPSAKIKRKEPQSIAARASVRRMTGSRRTHDIVLMPATSRRASNQRGTIPPAYRRFQPLRVAGWFPRSPIEQIPNQRRSSGRGYEDESHALPGTDLRGSIHICVAHRGDHRVTTGHRMVGQEDDGFAARRQLDRAAHHPFAG